MSEKSKGDTSSRIVKNPLLSASVTGLTSDDFQHKPLLLPAAPPIIQTTPLVGNNPEDETKSTQLIASEIDSDTFSEINLDAPIDEDISSADLGGDNLRSGQTITDDSILSQAASSFSQLPTVASSVFSTFSKVIKDYSPSTNNTSENNSECTTPKLETTSEIQAATPFFFSSPYPQASSFGDQPIPEPPKFYSPSEIVQSSTQPPSVPPPVSGQNTYRLSVKKKTYAQIPGITTSFTGGQTQQLPTQFVPTSNHPPQPDISPLNRPDSESPKSDSVTLSQKPEERKGLFSFASFVPPVLQNLTGLGPTSSKSNENISTEPDVVNHDLRTINPYSENPTGQENIPVVPQLYTPPTYFSTIDNNTKSVPPPPLRSTLSANKENSSQHIPSIEFFNPSLTSQNILSQPSINPPELQSNVPVPCFPVPSSEESIKNPSVFPPPPVSFDCSSAFGNYPNQQKETSQDNKTQLFSPPSQFRETNDHLINSNLKTLVPDNKSISLDSSILNPPVQPPLKPPTHSGSNTFRLQKGTRLYKSAFSAGGTSYVPPTPVFGGFPSTVSQENNFPPPILSSNLPNFGEQNQSYLVDQENLPPPPPTFFNPVQLLPQQTEQKQQQTNTSFVPNLFPAQDTIQAAQQDLSKNLQTVREQQKLEKAKEPEVISNQSNETESVLHVKDSVEASAPPFESLPVHKLSFLTEVNIFPVFKEEGLVKSEAFKKELPQRKSPLPSNLFKPRDVLTPVVETVNPAVLFPTNTTVDTNQNQFIIPPSQPLIYLQNPTESVRTPENNNTSGVVEKEIPSITNYFSNQVNNNLPQQQPLPSSNTFDNNVQAEAPVLNIPVQSDPVVNFFSVEQQPTSKPSIATSIFQERPSVQQPPQIIAPLPDPLSFFDSFHNSSSPSISAENSFNNNAAEDPNSLRIQNFFNNPPQNFSDSISELNYKLVGRGIIDKRLENLTVENNEETRAVSPTSNLVEPPSSSCSEFSNDYSQLPVYLSKLSPEELPDEIIEKLKMSNLNGGESSISSKSSSNVAYRPVTKHWFFNKNNNKKPNWMPFSQHDSDVLEEAYLSTDGSEVVPVEGGRYDVNIKERKRYAVYWLAEPTEVRRCSWFYKSVDSRYVPYEEDVAEKLEEEYKAASISGEWRRKVLLPSGENVTFHGPSVMVHFHHPQVADVWGSSSTTPARPRVVKREIEDFNIEPGESSKVDHLLLMVHGIGSACDLKFRTVEEVVDEFRSIATQLIQSHYKSSCDVGEVGRVEVLPVSWHSELHSKESGIDERLRAITLESIPKLRNFTNDTLVDVLFYTSPVFCQNIITTVCTAMNNIYIKYCQRNPDFKGGVSLAGHSLGSLILFDLLCHQNPVDDIEVQNSENPDQIIQPFVSDAQSNQTEMTSISYTVGPAGTGQPFINYPQLIFQPRRFFALGSPIGMFVTIRGIDALGLDFKLPSCPGFYNIFHPYDPVAYRIEALVNPELSSVRPVLIPHHKGRKRMHLELKETMTRVSADLKQKIVDTFKNTFDSVYYLTSRNKQTDPQDIQKEVDKVLDMQLKAGEDMRSRSTSMSSDPESVEIDLPLGRLNNSRRIDYVLQEAPLEFFNEYLFALTSHVCYWESEDTILFIMKEIYSSFGINPDSQVPQQSMTIERPSSRKGSSNDSQEGPSK